MARCASWRCGVICCLLIMSIIWVAGNDEYHAHAATNNRNILFVFLQGINTRLSEEEAGNGVIPDRINSFGQADGIYTSLKSRFPSADFLMYSYSGSTSTGRPLAYRCADTFRDPIVVDVQALGAQIGAALKDKPDTDIYLIGHSLGGAVALSYLAALYQPAAQRLVADLPAGAHLAGVITLDSPLGGVSDDPAYFDVTALVFHWLPIIVLKRLGLILPCGIPGEEFRSVRDLIGVFQTNKNAVDGNDDARGSHASLGEEIAGGVAESNQQMVEKAAMLRRTAVLTIGNTRDFLWDPAACPTNILGMKIPQVQFLSTQWVENKATGVYSWEFTDGDEDCARSLLFNAANHYEVLTNGSVEEQIEQFVAR